MSLEDLKSDIESEYGELGDELIVELDRETRNELAMLSVALEPHSLDEVVRRAVHMFFQTTVETGRLDFNLRNAQDVTYDEYLSGMTLEQMTGTQFPPPQPNDDRRYQF